MKKIPRAVCFEGEEANEPGPGYKNPLAIAARSHLESGQSEDSWVKRLLQLNPQERVLAIEKEQ